MTIDRNTCTDHRAFAAYPAWYVRKTDRR